MFENLEHIFFISVKLIHYIYHQNRGNGSQIMFFMLLSFFLLLGFSMWTPFWHSRMSKKWTTYYSMWNLLHLFADSCSIFDCAVSIRRPLALHNIEIRCSKFKLSQLWVDKCPHKKKNTFSTLIFKLVLVLATGAQLLLYYIQH